jgi:uncharacterized membrane protein
MPEQVVETPADAEPAMPIPAPAEPAAPVATTVAAEPVAPVAPVVEDSSSIEYLIGAAVIVCLGALWKVYRKLAQKQKR